MADVIRIARSPIVLIGNLRRSRANTVTITSTWGMIPALSLMVAIGLFTISLSFSFARSDESAAEILFWAGLALMFVPVFGRLLSIHPSRTERIGLAVVLGLGFYLVKVMHSPVMFTHHDEFLHWRTTNDILSTGELFHPNPLLPVSALFPALENVTVAFMELTGLSMFTSGLIVVGASRVVLILALFLIFEAVSNSFTRNTIKPAIVSESGVMRWPIGQSARVAGVATALYLVHPNFLFFNGMYKYETLALPFAGVVIYAMVRRQGIVHGQTAGFTLVAMFAIMVVTVTHHLTAYALLGLLLLWVLVTQVVRRYDLNIPTPGNLFVFALLLSVAWLLLVADVVVGYIAPHITAATQEVLAIIAQEEGSGRELFGSSSGSTGGTSVPAWERYTALAAVGLLLLAIPFGLWNIWKQHRQSAIALTLAVGVLAYPAGLALRFTGAGWEIGNRTSEFVFLAVGFVVATGIVRVLLARNPGILRTSIVVLCGVVILFGGIISGWPPAWRLPGPYEAAHSGTRSIEEQGVMAAVWTESQLGPDNKIGADSTNHLLQGSIGRQHVQTSLSGGLDSKWVLFAPELSTDLLDHIELHEVRYFVVDERWADEVDHSRQYPETPISAGLAKFDDEPQISRIFDSGDVIIYDLQRLMMDHQEEVVVRDSPDKTAF